MTFWRMTLTIVVILTASTALAGELEEILDCDPDARVSVDNIAGSVTVRAWNRNEIRFYVKTGSDVERVEFSRSAGHPGVEIVIPRHVRGRSDIECQIEIDCPPGVSLDVECISAGVVVYGIRGELEIETVSGGVKVQDAGDDVDVETVSGGVNVTGAMKDVKISTTSGGVNIEGTAKAISAETVSGSISVVGDVEKARLHTTSSRIQLKGNVDTIDAETVSARVEVDRVHHEADIATMSGSIHVIGVLPEDVQLEAFSSSVGYEGGLKPGGRLDVSTKSGSINVALPANIGATFDMATMSGGIHNEFPGAPAVKQGFGPGKELEFSVGDGGIQVDLESFSSSISVRRLPPVPETRHGREPALLEAPHLPGE